MRISHSWATSEHQTAWKWGKVVISNHDSEEKQITAFWSVVCWFYCYWFYCSCCSSVTYEIRAPSGTKVYSISVWIRAVLWRHWVLTLEVFLQRSEGTKSGITYFNICIISGLLHWTERGFFILVFLKVPFHWGLFLFVFFFFCINRSMLSTVMLSPGRESLATLIYLRLGISGAGLWRLCWSAAMGCAGLLASPGNSLR